MIYSDIIARHVACCGTKFPNKFYVYHCSGITAYSLPAVDKLNTFLEGRAPENFVCTLTTKNVHTVETLSEDSTSLIKW